MALTNGVTLIQQALANLMGLNMFKSWNVFATRYFYFRQSRAKPFDFDTDEDYSLMLECPWRIETADRIIVGSEDYGVRAESNENPDWSSVADQLGHRQDVKLTELMGEIRAGSIFNVREHLVVNSVQVDAVGGFRLGFVDGSALAIFPASESDVDWILAKRNNGTVGLINGAVEGGLVSRN